MVETMSWRALTSSLMGPVSTPVVVEVIRDSDASGSRSVPVSGLDGEAGACLIESVTAGLVQAGFTCDWSGLRVAVYGCVGEACDLGLALSAAFLAATRQGSVASLTSSLYLGGVAKDGSILPVRGILAHLSYARTHGLTLVCGIAPYVTDVPWNCRRIVCSVAELRFRLVPEPGPIARLRQSNDRDLRLVGEVRGCAHAKRAACIALTGGHALGLVVEDMNLARKFVLGMQEMALPLPVSRRREVALARSVAGLERGRESEGLRPLVCVGGAGSDIVSAYEAHALARHGILVVEDAAAIDEEILGEIRSDPTILVVVVVARDEVRRQTDAAQRALAYVDIACMLSKSDRDKRVPSAWGELADAVREGSAFAVQRNARSWEDPAEAVASPRELVECVVAKRGLTLTAERQRIAADVARTVADLACVTTVAEHHVATALTLVMGGIPRM